MLSQNLDAPFWPASPGREEGLLQGARALLTTKSHGTNFISKHIHEAQRGGASQS